MTGLPLAPVADPGQVDCLRAQIAGRACVVIGAAPLPTPTAPVDDAEYLIAVNGGISSAPRAVDLWVVGSKVWDKPGQMDARPMHQQMLAQATGRSVRYALLLRGPKEATEGHTLARLHQLRCTIEAWSVLDKPTKRWLEGELCARVDDKQPCSSGMLAAAMALWCGAATVRLVGFSFTHPGYHYLPRTPGQRWWRGHVPADRRALVALRRRFGLRVSGPICEAMAA